MWKIQFAGVNGWFDLKESLEEPNNLKEYKVCLFETKEAATNESVSLSDIFEEESRVVRVTHKKTGLRTAKIKQLQLYDTRKRKTIDQAEEDSVGS